MYRHTHAPIHTRAILLLVSAGCLAGISSAWAAVPAAWMPRGIGGGGAFFAPSINPDDPSEFYVASDMSELFHTLDFGLSYEMIDFRRLRASTLSRVAFTSDPSIRYCIDFSDDRQTPVGSHDGGLTWEPLPGNPDPWEPVYYLFADYDDPARLLITHYGRLYFSADGGASFELVYQYSPMHVGGVFFDGEDIFVGTGFGLLVSTDGGATFALSPIAGIPAGEGIMSMTGSRAGGGAVRLWALTCDAGSIYVPFLEWGEYWGLAEGVYRLDLPAGEWVAASSGVNTEADFPTRIAAPAHDPDIAYLAGGSSAGAPIVMKTSDGGAHWAHVFLTTNNENIATGWSGDGGDRSWGYGEMAYGISVARFDADRAIFSDMGFVHKTADGGATWSQAYVDPSCQHGMGAPTPRGEPYLSVGLEDTSCWQVHWFTPDILFAGFADIRATRSADGGATWSFNYSGLDQNTTCWVVDRPAADIAYAGTSSLHDIYQSHVLYDASIDPAHGRISYSTDDGLTWHVLHDFNHPVYWLALDPQDENTMYASVIHHGQGEGGIYACHDLDLGPASSWTRLPAPPRTEGHPHTVIVLRDGSVLATYSARRDNGYPGAGTFTPSSGVFLYDPGSGTWSDRSDPGMYYWTKDVVVDTDHDPGENTWYACVFSGWGGEANDLGGLYRTTDRGLAWERVSTIDRVESITFNPQDPEQVFLTSEDDGLWVCDQITAADPAFIPVENYPFKHPERVFFNPYDSNEIWVASYGHGLRLGSVSGSDVQPRREALCAGWQLDCTIPMRGAATIRYRVPEAGQVSLKLFDVRGAQIATLAQGWSRAGSHEVALGSGALPSGLYFCRLQGGSHRLVQRMVIVP